MESPFGAWLREQNISFAEFGRRIGVTDSAVLRWARAQRCPGVTEAFAIERETSGAIAAASWDRAAAAKPPDAPKQKAARQSQRRPKHRRSASH